MKKIERAIISVFDKSNIVEFVRSLTKFGIKILSTGGTGRLLTENGINFEKISDYTSSPEMFDGRVKTLHPKIEGGILFRREFKKDYEDALKYNIPPIDMVVCNLYQFKEAIAKPEVTLTDALEMIDIGGPTMIRAAAKNFPDVVVVPNTKHYSEIIEELEQLGGISDKTRAKLAQEVFIIMADYNATIANYLQNYFNPDQIMKANIFNSYEKIQDCRYGENWDQAAAYYKDLSCIEGLHNLKQIGGKQISFNNYLDIDACIQMLLDFDRNQFVTAILKHTSPNGIAIDKFDQLQSIKMAFKTDPLSAFGGIWGVNKELTANAADYIINKEKIFVDVLLAPSFENEALDILKQKKDMRIIEFGDLLEKRELIYKNHEIRSVLGGILVQEYDYKPIIKEWNVVSK
ncbi:MAG: bifunctional phosphoribosylaminoimidazolecarboxamide formyltransferase/IMP cyclohydrolase, partial [Promethearchaeota archaeon]